MKLNPYNRVIEDIRQVLKNLIKMMCDPELDMKIFRNVAAVYVSWQATLHLAEIEAMDWDLSRT